MNKTTLRGLGVLIVMLLVATTICAETTDNSYNRTTVQLVVNGGCDMTLVGGEIPFWEEVIGTVWTQRQSNPSPWDGDNYFFAGAAANAELRQDVDLADLAGMIDTGNQLFSFLAYVRAWDQSPPDVSQIILQYLNADKTQVLANYDLGQYASTTAWVPVSHSATAPVGTRYIRIRLISIRHAGTNNDGYFDAVSLTINIPELMAPDDVEILIQGNDVALSWSPVTTDTSGNPVSVSLYRIYAGDEPYFIISPANLVGTSSTPEILLVGHPGMDRMFYKVIAVE